MEMKKELSIKLGDAIRNLKWTVCNNTVTLVFLNSYH